MDLGLGQLIERPPKELPPKDAIRRIATQALLDVSKDAKAPPAARAAAARTLLESLGDIGRLQNLQRQSEKPLNEMTSAELEQEMQRLKAEGDETET